MISLLLAALLGATPADAEASYRAGLAAQADATIARPHFIAAAEGFEAQWDRGSRSPGLAGNMAQARLLAGDVGRAIRNYRRGLRVFPHDPGLKRGLEFARGEVNYPLANDVRDLARPRETGSLLDRLPLTITRLIAGAAVLAAVGWVTLARAAIVRRGGLALVGATMVVGATAVGIWGWVEDDRARRHWGERTAVVVQGADLRMGNSEEYPKRIDGRLPAGTELRILGDRGGWLHVELGSGIAGWVRGDRAVEVD
jgi:hypothetical protein